MRIRMRLTVVQKTPMKRKVRVATHTPKVNMRSAGGSSSKFVKFSRYKPSKNRN
jgi:hypothetical protein